jgi:hypothetical protein
VRAGDREDPFVVQHVLREPLRARAVRQSRVEQRFDDRLAATQRVADDHAVEPGVDGAPFVALLDANAEALELRAHGRINILIGTGHLMARRLRDRREPAHEGPADTEDMNPH